MFTSLCTKLTQENTAQGYAREDNVDKKKVKKDNIALEFDKAEKKWIPTVGGTIFGYIPEYRKHDSKWERIPTTMISGGFGVPYPYCNGGILQTILLYGNAQAQALAWLYKATCEANADMFTEVRVVEFEVVFDIKARRIDEANSEK